MDLLDDFISDILLPCTRKVLPSQELFDLYVKYCAFHETPSEVSPIVFGRGVSGRLHSTRRNGRTFYYCEVNPKRLK